MCGGGRGILGGRQFTTYIAQESLALAHKKRLRKIKRRRDFFWVCLLKTERSLKQFFLVSDTITIRSYANSAVHVAANPTEAQERRRKKREKTPLQYPASTVSRNTLASSKHFFLRASSFLQLEHAAFIFSPTPTS